MYCHILVIPVLKLSIINHQRYTISLSVKRSVLISLMTSMLRYMYTGKQTVFQNTQSEYMAKCKSEISKKNICIRQAICSIQAIK